VLKEASAAELVRAIREVVAGRRYLSPPFAERAAELERRAAEPGDGGPYATLTAREREILHLSAEGRTSAELAERLGISPRTAETHRSNLMRKMGFRGKADLIRYAVQHGLLPPGEPPAAAAESQD
jgi:DNA-binding NarL/FixJ family response regulator